MTKYPSKGIPNITSLETMEWIAMRRVITTLFLWMLLAGCGTGTASPTATSNAADGSVIVWNVAQ
jgi:hypothetical protein